MPSIPQAIERLYDLNVGVIGTGTGRHERPHKNHHWAMDRYLIAPGPDLRWHVASTLIPHRSTGEAELAQLAHHPVLPPHDLAFTPDQRALQWRMERLGA